MKVDFSSTKIDAVFERSRKLTYTRSVSFSTIVEVMWAVVIRKSPPINAALDKKAEDHPIS